MRDDLGFIPTDKETLQSLAHVNIFVIGDASNIPRLLSLPIHRNSNETYETNTTCTGSRTRKQIWQFEANGPDRT